MRYFWWAEFQRRGAIHYHMLLVDAPFADEATAKRWLTVHWTDASGAQLAGIQAWTRWRSAVWFRQSGADYVMKDARKGHRKAYEQDYARMPRGWRTFRCHQLTYAAAEHEAHETKAHTVCTSAPDASFAVRQHDIWIYRVDRHVPHPGGCRLTRPRARKRAALPSVCTSVLRPGGQHQPTPVGQESPPAPPPAVQEQAIYTTGSAPLAPVAIQSMSAVTGPDGAQMCLSLLATKPRKRTTHA